MNYKDRLGQPINLGDAVLINDNHLVVGVVYRFTEHNIFVQCLDGQKHTGGHGYYTVINEQLSAIGIDTREKIIKKYHDLMQEGRDLTQKELLRINSKKACSYCIFVYNEASCTNVASSNVAAGMQFLLNEVSTNPTYLILVPNQTTSKSATVWHNARHIAEQKLFNMGLIPPSNDCRVGFFYKKVNWPVDENGTPITYLTLHNHEQSYSSSAWRKFREHKARKKLNPVLTAESNNYRMSRVISMIGCESQKVAEQFFSPAEVKKLFNLQSEQTEVIKLPDDPNTWPDQGLILC